MQVMYCKSFAYFRLNRYSHLRRSLNLVNLWANLPQIIQLAAFSQTWWTETKTGASINIHTSVLSRRLIHFIILVIVLVSWLIFTHTWAHREHKWSEHRHHHHFPHNQHYHYYQWYSWQAHRKHAYTFLQSKLICDIRNTVNTMAKLIDTRCVSYLNMPPFKVFRASGMTTAESSFISCTCR